MEIRVLGSFGARIPGYSTSSLLLDGRLLLDAGTVTSVLPLEEQAAIDDVLLTHAHLDHMVDLAFLADNTFTVRTRPLRLWGPGPVLEAVHRHLFNDHVWPDFTCLKGPGGPALQLCPLAAGEVGEVAGFRVAWEQTRHPVFTAGYCLGDGNGSILFSGDTAATEDLWRLGRSCPDLRAVFIETSFPDRLADLAATSGHLTPRGLAGELAKLGRNDLPTLIFHMKPQFLEEIVRELEELGEPHLRILQGGEVFTF